MSHNTDMKRLTRLSAILLQLQTKRVVSSPELAEKYNVSVRTIYRDLKVLEEIGIPISGIDGKGYSLSEGFRIPPIMFTESEASALVIAEKLIRLHNDSSLTAAYKDAADKIKSVLNYAAKDKIEMLSSRIATSPAIPMRDSSNTLSVIQNALLNFLITHISYRAVGKNVCSERAIEPFAFYYSMQQQWTLIAFCRLRRDFRMFRLDRIEKVIVTKQVFAPHQLSLTQFLQEKEKNFINPDKLLS
jgi:predicted DNA-binding transcriptional regulator YafY